MPVAHVHYLGHATTLIQVDGQTILTDPVFGDRVLHLRRRGVSGKAWRQSMPAPDFILLSHLHLDHFHLPSLRRLPRHLPIIVPRGTAHRLRLVLRHPLMELAPGESITFGAVTIEATYAHHGRRHGQHRSIFDLAQGYLIKSDKTIYFPGDTDLFPEMREIGDRALDLALLPVWGWGPTLGPGHLDPDRAAQALTLLRPRVAIPIHWAAFRPLGPVWESMSYLHNPGPEFRRLAADYAPDTAVHLVAPGESFELI